MNDTKISVTGALLAVLAALFQSIPVLFSEVFILLTVFSSIPIYIACRINPKTGVLAYLVASMMVMLISVHEGLFFLCTNGLVGASLGICSYCTDKRALIKLVSSLVLAAALSIMNYGIGIPVFGTNLPGTYTIQLSIILLFSASYSTIYYYFSNYIFKLLKKHFL